MTLKDIVASLDRLDGDSTIYAAQPWTADSAALVRREPDSGDPADAAQQRMDYFLEVAIAQEVMHEWVATRPDAGLLARCERLIAYAINDA